LRLFRLISFIIYCHFQSVFKLLITSRIHNGVYQFSFQGEFSGVDAGAIDLMRLIDFRATLFSKMERN